MHHEMSNKYASPTSVIIPGSGTMFNEVTQIKPTTKKVNENTNTYAVTVPLHIKRKTKTKKSHKSKSKKTKK